MSARILIIEDNPANLELMTYLLMAFGYLVVAAEDGLHGVEAAGMKMPDLIICDVQLPDIDGFEVARRVRRNPSLRSIPLVAVTALAMMGDRNRVLAAGFDGYLSKPIDPEIFVQQIEAFISPRRQSLRDCSYSCVEMVETPAIKHRFTVLVVDDLSVNLDLARGILVPSGYNVLTARGMSEGLGIARQSACDLILSDVCMEQDSGYDFLIAVRADPGLHAIPFILITSTMMDEKDRKLGLTLGADQFLWRPIEPDALLAAVGRCLPVKGMS
jgi:two-component system cell cycle response regulator